MKIGERIKALREAKGMSLTQLSKASGVALATLSRMEHDKMVGTLESHINIAKALGINLTELYSQASIELKKTNQPYLEKEKGVFVHSDKSIVEILTNQIFSKKMMPTLIKLEPNGKTTTEQGSAATEKFVYVLEGKVELNINNSNYSLNEGESLYFDGGLPHHLKNSGKAASKVLCISTPPSL